MRVSISKQNNSLFIKNSIYILPFMGQNQENKSPSVSYPMETQKEISADMNVTLTEKST